MRKLFFFKSSSSNSGNTQVPLETDKQAYWENTSVNGPSKQFNNRSRSPNGFFPEVQKPKHETQSSVASSGLTRSLSLSSVVFNSDQSMSPSSSSCGMPPQQFNLSSRCRSPTPEKPMKVQGCEPEVAHVFEKPISGSFCSGHQASHGASSRSTSSTIPSTVLDLYIDGEQQQERSRPKSNSSQRIQSGNGCGRRPPRVQYTAPASPEDGLQGRPRGSRSPQRLANNVIEKLSLSDISSRQSSKDLDPNMPFTLEDIYGGAWDTCSGLTSAPVDPKIVPFDETHEMDHGYHPKEVYKKQKYFLGEDLNSIDNNEIIGVELQRKFQEAKERALFFSEELEREKFFQDSWSDMPALVQTIRHLSEERLNLADEVSAALQGQLEERALAKENLRLAKVELESQTRRLEREKNELQTRLEKELDRRTSDWSSKLLKYQSEEQRLRQRVRELAEQNVSLQKEVSSFTEKEAESRNLIKHSQSQLGDLHLKLEEVKQQNQELQQNISRLEEKYLIAEEERACLRRNCDERGDECKELQKSIARLLRTCNEQEKTISGLRGLIEETEKNQSNEKSDNHVGKLQMEQVRLVGVEQTLRREVESYRSEVDSLRQENINLLNRLKVGGKDGSASTYKLDQQLGNQLSCLQGQGLVLLTQSIRLSSKLLEFIKEKTGYISGTKLSADHMNDGLGRQFVFDSDVKVQGFKRGAENLDRSLRIISSVLHEKPNTMVLESQSHCANQTGVGQPCDHAAEESIRRELKAETLLTRLLQNKLYSKELDVEQLQAELATAVRGADILRCEVQNTMDTLTCATHKLKDLEVQILKKDENMNRLQNDLQESTKELQIMRGMLPKISDERDIMWEEVKQYSEKNMLLNSQVKALKKKVEALDEDVLLKEGQIAILKDALGDGRTFDLLAASPQCT